MNKIIREEQRKYKKAPKPKQQDEIGQRGKRRKKIGNKDAGYRQCSTW